MLRNVKDHYYYHYYKQILEAIRNKGKVRQRTRCYPERRNPEIENSYPRKIMPPMY